MSTDFFIGMCSKCGKNPISPDFESKRLCEPCAMETARVIYQQAAKGGKVLQFDKNAPASPIVQEAEKIIESIVGTQVVFVNQKGQSHEIRITPEEQKEISEKIVKNRTTGRKTLMCAQVVVAGAEKFVEAERIIKLCAEGNFDGVQELAKKFLEITEIK